MKNRKVSIKTTIIVAILSGIILGPLLSLVETGIIVLLSDYAWYLKVCVVTLYYAVGSLLYRSYSENRPLLGFLSLLIGCIWTVAGSCYILYVLKMWNIASPSSLKELLGLILTMSLSSVIFGLVANFGIPPIITLFKKKRKVLSEKNLITRSHFDNYNL